MPPRRARYMNQTLADNPALLLDNANASRFAYASFSQPHSHTHLTEAFVP